jgi:hypothetical protein
MTSSYCPLLFNPNADAIALGSNHMYGGYQPSFAWSTL